MDRGRVRTFSLTLEEHPLRTIQLAPDPAAGAAQREAFSAWTGQPFPAPRAAQP